MTSFLWSAVKSTSGTIKFNVDNNSTHEMTLSGGNLGIGTSSPSSNLHVAGNTIVSDTLSVGTTSSSSNLNVSGTIGYSVETMTSDLTSPANTIILADTTSANLNLTLPLASSANGRLYQIKKVTNTGMLTVYPYGSDNIEGGLYLNLTNNGSSSALPTISLLSDGNSWLILSQLLDSSAVFPALSLLYEDNFNDNSINTGIWTVNAGSPTEAGGVLTIATANANGMQMTSNDAIDMAQDAVFIVDWSNFSNTGNGETAFRLVGNGWTIWFHREDWGTDRIKFRVDNGGQTNTIVNTANTSGKFMFEYSSASGVVTGSWHDGSAWQEVANTSGNVLSTTNGIKTNFYAWVSASENIQIDYDNLKVFGTLGP